MSWYLLRNSEGKKDGMWTISWLSFLVWFMHALIIGLLGGSAFVFTGKTISVTITIPATFEWTSLVALIPTWAGYIIRKHEIFKKTAGEDIEETD